MPLFNLEFEDPNGNTRILNYNSDNSTLYHENGDEYILPNRRVLNFNIHETNYQPYIPYNPESMPVKRNTNGVFNDIRIFLGAKCNYRCVYCYQEDVRENEPSFTLESVDKFMNEIDSWYAGGGTIVRRADHTTYLPTDGTGTRVQFWGGEPLVYWKIVKELITRLKAKYPRMTFSMVSNGSLLREEHFQFFKENKMAISVSHDGPGQAYRGLDPLTDPEAGPIIQKFYENNMLYLSPTLNAKNNSKKAIIDYFRERFPKIGTLGEGDFLEIFNPTNEKQMELTINDSHTAHSLAKASFEELIKYPEITPIFSIVKDRINNLYDILYNKTNISTFQDKCGTTQPSRMVIDCEGNMILCHHGQRPTDISPCSSNKKAVDIKKDNELFLATHWSFKKGCRECPVLQMCKGGCVITTDDAHEANCAATFSDHVSTLAYGLYMLTGLKLKYIKGPHTEFYPERYDPFGLDDDKNENIVYKYKVIPIKVA